MELDGLDKLLDKLEKMDNEIEGDVDTIVKNNTIEMTEKTIKNERIRFDKGYWTGHTARNTKTVKIGNMEYKTYVNTDYAAYLEYGTRYYTGAAGFLHEVFFKQKQIFLADMESLVK